MLRLLSLVAFASFLGSAISFPVASSHITETSHQQITDDLKLKSTTGRPYEYGGLFGSQSLAINSQPENQTPTQYLPEPQSYAPQALAEPVEYEPETQLDTPSDNPSTSDNVQPQLDSSPPPSPKRVGSVPDQFRILEADTVILQKAVRAYNGDINDAKIIAAIEERLQLDFEDAITAIDNAPYNFFNFFEAQPSVIKVLKNCNDIGNDLLRKKDVINYYGGGTYFVNTFKTQLGLAKRMQAAINSKLPSALLKLGASAEFDYLYRSLNRFITSW